MAQYEAVPVRRRQGLRTWVTRPRHRHAMVVTVAKCGASQKYGPWQRHYRPAPAAPAHRVKLRPYVIALNSSRYIPETVGDMLAGCHHLDFAKTTTCPPCTDLNGILSSRRLSQLPWMSVQSTLSGIWEKCCEHQPSMADQHHKAFVLYRTLYKGNFFGC